MNIQGLECIENIPLDIMIDNNNHIKCINGINMLFDIEFNKCFICKNDVYIKRTLPFFYYCRDCNINLCIMCDIKHANNHSRFKRIIGPENIYIICNNCDKVFYTNLVYRNYKLDIDCCIECSIKPEGKKLIEDNRLELYHFKNKYDNSNFGKLYDWIVIYKDDEENYIIYCDNINSIHYDCYGLYITDNLNKIGLYSLSNKWKIQDLKLILEKYYNDIEWKLMTGLYYFNNFPIKRFMKDNNMEITFSL